MSEAVKALEESGDFRVLHRLDLSDLPHARDANLDFSARVALVIDTETTGSDPDKDAIIELAARLAWFDENGVIVALGDSVSWLEDPGAPLSSAVRRDTGLEIVDLLGCRIDEVVLSELVASADLVISHKAGVDRKLFERRFPQWRNLAWACSRTEIQWPLYGYEGCTLKTLLLQAGRFAAHPSRAADDVDMLVGLLRTELADTGRTALAELLRVAKRDSWLVRADGANFDVKTDLKERGYRLNTRDCVWERDVEIDDLEAEKSWLAASVYAPRFYPTASGPRIERITWRERHR